MAAYLYTEKNRLSVESGKIVKKKVDAIQFNGRTFTVGGIIGFQYGDIAFVGKLVEIDKKENVIYVSINTFTNPRLDGIYGFYLEQISEVYGTM